MRSRTPLQVGSTLAWRLLYGVMHTPSRRAPSPARRRVGKALLAAVVVACLGATATPARGADLDVAALRVRLHDTAGMGLVAKLSLRREIVGLIEALAAFHAGRSAATLDALHAAYTALVTKAVGLLDGSDAALARDLATSRDRIWAELADPARFAALTHI